jgi:hypothetical protein
MRQTGARLNEYTTVTLVSVKCAEKRKAVPSVTFFELIAAARGEDIELNAKVTLDISWVRFRTAFVRTRLAFQARSGARVEAQQAAAPKRSPKGICTAR